MTTLKVAHAADAAITCTLASLASNSWRQSAVVDNSSNLYVDALVGGSVQVGTSPAAGGKINIYAYAQWGDAGDYTAGASGSDGSYTADGEETLLKLLESITVDATSDQDYSWGPVSVAAAFGGVLPPRWGIVVHNNTSAALNSTGTNNEVAYQGINYTST